MNTIKTLSVSISAMLSILFVGEIAAQEWTKYINESEFFAANFHGEPIVTEAPYQGLYGATHPSKIFTVEEGDSRYSVTVVDFTDAQATYAERPHPTIETRGSWLWIYDQLGAVSHAAQQFRERGGAVTYDAWNHIDFVEGHQVQLTNEDGSRTFAGLYLHNKRLYVIEATVPGDAIPPSMFQQSIAFLDDKGERVRYRFDEEGVRTSVTNYPLDVSE